MFTAILLILGALFAVSVLVLAYAIGAALKEKDHRED